jgi:hypothetical protein
LSAAFLIPKPQCYVPGDSEQPIPNGPPIPEVRRFPSEDEECRLKRIIGIRSSAENPATGSQNHRSVSTNQLGERLLVRIRHEPSEQLLVGLHGFGQPSEQTGSFRIYTFHSLLPSLTRYSRADPRTVQLFRPI